MVWLLEEGLPMVWLMRRVPMVWVRLMVLPLLEIWKTWMMNTEMWELMVENNHHPNI